MIRRHFLKQSHYFPVPPRLKPVNSPTESQSTLTGYSLSRSSPGRAPVVAGSAPVKAGSVPAEPRYTVTPPALTVSIPASDPGRATLRQRPCFTPVVAGNAQAGPR
ncbi:hypothetical protein DPMN_082593 [Dreissena polymorpha]|uniref:Uncharacterized protein n=1 Tax=Dreissena polymorpha TaxID=45954 RepID=A0A9D4BHF8_DREPO|nr:hypothetical protein DPMN_082593 [Dreissena polymorpha]